MVRRDIGFQAAGKVPFVTQDPTRMSKIKDDLARADHVVSLDEAKSKHFEKFSLQRILEALVVFDTAARSGPGIENVGVRWINRLGIHVPQ